MEKYKSGEVVGRGLLDVDDHLLVYVGIADHAAELLEGDLAVLVAVREQDGLVHDLLELRVLQVVAHHHLQDLRPDNTVTRN